MGREVRRVPRDFDWPIGRVWPGFMAGVCDEDISYCLGDKDADAETICDACKHAGRLIGIFSDGDACPRWKHDPPKGDGWQLWETVSEGSPISPVFATPEELAIWLSTPGNDTSITAGRAYDEWLRFLTGPGWAPSMVMSPERGLEDGVAFVARTEEEKSRCSQP